MHRWHPVCSLVGHLKDWLPGVAGTDPRLGYRLGASITKRGLAPAPFFISVAIQSSPPQKPRLACLFGHNQAAHRYRRTQVVKHFGSSSEKSGETVYVHGEFSAPPVREPSQVSCKPKK